MAFPRFKPVDATPGQFLFMDEAHGYGRHRDSGAAFDSTLGRMDWRTMTWGPLFDFAALQGDTPAIQAVLDCPLGKFVVVRSLSGGLLANVYRAADWNAGWVETLKLGWDGATQNPSVYTLEGMVYDERRNCIYVAEYNTASGTLAAGRYLVRIMKYSLAGWEQLVEFNRAATTEAGCLIRHFHGVRIDPYTGLVYVSTGDSADQSHLIEWDPDAGTWADDTAGATLAARTGFRAINGAILGVTDDRVRGIYVSFTRDFIYWGRDGSGSVNGLINRVRKSDFRFEQLRTNNGAITWSPGYGSDGWASMTLRDGRTLVAAIPTASAPANLSMVRLYANDFPDSVDFHPVACINCAASSLAIVRQLGYQPGTDRIVISGDNWAGMRQDSTHPNPGNATNRDTVIAVLDGDYYGYRPDVLAPVRFVDPATGNDNDAYAGQRRKSPLATLERALVQRVTYGTRVMVAEGRHSLTGASTMRFDSTIGNNGFAGDDVVVTGEGADRTLVQYDGAAGGAAFLFGFANHSLVLERIGTVKGKESAYIDYNISNGTSSCTLTLIDSILGHAEKTGNTSVFAREGAVRILRSKIVHSASADANSKNALDTNTNNGACSILIIGSIIDGGFAGLRCDQTNVTLRVFNTAFLNQVTDEAIYFVTTGPVLFQGDNLVFTSNSLKASAAASAYDVGAVYAETPSAALSAQARRVISAGALFKDAANADFTPLAGSALIERGEGISADLLRVSRFAQQWLGGLGYMGSALRNRPTLGPVEYRSGERAGATR